jgi:hypothetical protein
VVPDEPPLDGDAPPVLEPPPEDAVDFVSLFDPHPVLVALAARATQTVEPREPILGWLSLVALALQRRTSTTLCAVVLRRTIVRVSFYRRSSASAFDWQGSTPWPCYLTALVSGDLNEDGRPDLISTEGYTDTLLLCPYSNNFTVILNRALCR